MDGRNGNERMDLTGDRYGKLEVMGPAPDVGGRPVWRCRCDCGNEVVVRANNLRSGRTRSCGCLKNSRLDLAGKRFGRLVAMEPAETVDRNTGWRCKCDCGNEVVIRTSSLTSGATKSCGCLSADLHMESRADLTGQEFGDLTALEPAGHLGKDTAWRCKCACGREVIARTRDLRSGGVKSCGRHRGLRRRALAADGDGKKG